MAGCIAIVSHATAEPLVRFLVLHEPMDVQFHCVIIKRLQLKSKKKKFSYKSLRRSTRSISQGTEVTIETEYIFINVFNIEDTGDNCHT